MWNGFNDLASVRPDLAKQWHLTKNGNLRPTEVAVNSRKKVWWIFPYDDPKTGKHFDFEWQARVYDRNKGYGCPYLNGQAVWEGFNDLATMNPDIAAQWHPTKNGDLNQQILHREVRKKFGGYSLMMTQKQESILILNGRLQLIIEQNIIVVVHS